MLLSELQYLFFQVKYDGLTKELLVWKELIFSRNSPILPLIIIITDIANAD
jgi:hypothetical protein